MSCSNASHYWQQAGSISGIMYWQDLMRDWSEAYWQLCLIFASLRSFAALTEQFLYQVSDWILDKMHYIVRQRRLDTICPSEQIAVRCV